jgi:ankyrin repeat protein
VISRQILGVAVGVSLAFFAVFWVLRTMERVLRQRAFQRVRQTTFQVAIADGDIDTVRSMLDRGEPIEGHPDEDEYLSPLEQAATGGEDKIVKLLLDGGADIHGGSGWGDALEAAIRFNHPSTAKLLISRGAWVNEGGDRKNGSLSLWAAIVAGNPPMVKLLLDAGANPDTLNPPYATALSLAAEDGNTAIVRLLKKAGAKRWRP